MTQVILAWTPNAANQMVTHYEVQQTKDGVTEILEQKPTEATLTLVDLPAGDYEWKVRAVNLAGAGPFSIAVSGPSLPSAPANPTVTIVGV